MNITELNKKISGYKSELIKDVETFVKENANYKVGDIIKGRINDNYYVITRVGFKGNEIGYLANKLVKSRCEVNFMDMWSGMMVSEDMINKVNFKFKGKEISRIEESTYFNYNLKIELKFNVI